MSRAGRAIRCLPYEAPDRRTSLADLRAALCLELGVDMADIDPASGYDVSRAAYETARHSWRRLAAEEPNLLDCGRCEQNYREARANWLNRRPDWDDDWLAPEAATLPASDPLLIPLFELETSR